MHDQTSSQHGAHAAPHAAAHGDLPTYLTGFALSLVLTALSFGAVMSGWIPHGMILPAIVVLALAQLLAQLVFFLHLGASGEQRSNTVILMLTVTLVVIVVGGSLWVVHNANENMMPHQMTPAAAAAHE
jgi:cytochrome o ubiquinol oxidase operon protein cyoD